MGMHAKADPHPAEPEARALQVIGSDNVNEKDDCIDEAVSLYILMMHSE